MSDFATGLWWRVGWWDMVGGAVFGGVCVRVVGEGGEEDAGPAQVGGDWACSRLRLVRAVALATAVTLVPRLRLGDLGQVGVGGGLPKESRHTPGLLTLQLTLQAQGLGGLLTLQVFRVTVTLLVIPLL